MATRKAATRKAPQNFTPYADTLGGKVTFNREDGYIAWQGAICLGSVNDIEDGQRVIVEYRNTRKAA